MIRLAADWPRVTSLLALAAGVLLAGAFTLGSLTTPAPAAPSLRPKLVAVQAQLARTSSRLTAAQASLKAGAARQAAQTVTIANLQARLRARPHHHRR